jgi:hypothetical protein
MNLAAHPTGENKGFDHVENVPVSGDVDENARYHDRLTQPDLPLETTPALYSLLATRPFRVRRQRGSGLLCRH